MIRDPPMLRPSGGLILFEVEPSLFHWKLSDLKGS